LLWQSLCLQESDDDIACATEELVSLVSDCDDRFRWLKDKVVAKWNKYEEKWEWLAEFGE
jgi:hypothetical protein